MTRAKSAESVATISTALAKGRQLLTQSGIHPDDIIIESRLLLQHVTGMTAEEVIGYPNRSIDELTAREYLKLIERRRQREPLAYITGAAEFYGRKFHIPRGILIPRPETETLVSLASDFASKRGMTAPTICDLGTGSGVLAITLALEIEHSRLTACDISALALKVAASNAARYDVAGRIDFQNADMTSATIGDALGTFDIIVANPPYIPTDRLANYLEPEVSHWEPRIALDGGPDGMDNLSPLIERIPMLLQDSAPSIALIEIDNDSAQRCLELATHAAPDAKVELIPDYAGLHRILAIEQPT